MVKYNSLLCILFSLNSFASTNGGGVLSVMPNDGGTVDSTHGGGVLSPVIVYHMGEKDGVVKFAYAQLINNKWDIKKLSATESEITSDMAAKAALDQSQNLHQWIELK